MQNTDKWIEIKLPDTFIHHIVRKIWIRGILQCGYIKYIIYAQNSRSTRIGIIAQHEHLEMNTLYYNSTWKYKGNAQEEVKYVFFRVALGITISFLKSRFWFKRIVKNLCRYKKAQIKILHKKLMKFDISYNDLLRHMLGIFVIRITFLPGSAYS